MANGEIKFQLNRRRFLSNGASLGLATAGFAMPALVTTPAEATRSRKDISYGPQKLDIYLPTAKSPLASSAGAPVIAFVHGGAWRLGNRTRVGRKAKYYTDQGFVFASIGYTLYPRADAGEQAEQIGKATNWLQANISEFGGNPDQLAVMGHSAGCHLASLATLSGRTNGVRGIICNDTRAYDLPFLAKMNGGRLPSLYSALRDRRYWSARSPISYTGLKQQPPALVLWSNGSGRDTVSANFIRALQRDGNQVKVYDGSSRYNHLSINSRIGNPRHEVTKVVDRFLMETLG